MLTTSLSRAVLGQLLDDLTGKSGRLLDITLDRFSTNANQDHAPRNAKFRRQL